MRSAKRSTSAVQNVPLASRDYRHTGFKYRVLAVKIRLPSCIVNISSFEAIGTEMDMKIEDEEYLDFSGETLERRRNFRAVLLHALLAKIAGFRQLTKNLIVAKNLMSGRTGLQ